MDSCDVLIIGGGPAGSTCAWKLRKSGLDVIVLDKATFPRDKVCGGWITPATLDELDLDTTEYSMCRVFQPIRGFLTSRMGNHAIQTLYHEAVSYGIRRCEFDHYLLRRCGARILTGTPLLELRRRNGSFIANSRIQAPLVVGAGGHFCPVAQYLGARPAGETAVVAQEIEFALSGRQAGQCSVRPEIPELYFCSDMKGYGWCFRKHDYLNIGLGRLDSVHLSQHVREFVAFLKEAGKVPHDMPEKLHGHAYLLYGHHTRRRAGDGMLCIGDSAGLAYPRSGEGIRAAIESGLLAGQTILKAGGDFRKKNLEEYDHLLGARFGDSKSNWINRLAGALPDTAVSCLAGWILSSRFFTRRVVLNHWFLHAEMPPLVL